MTVPMAARPPGNAPSRPACASSAAAPGVGGACNWDGAGQSCGAVAIPCAGRAAAPTARMCATSSDGIHRIDGSTRHASRPSPRSSMPPEMATRIVVCRSFCHSIPQGISEPSDASTSCTTKAWSAAPWWSEAVPDRTALHRSMRGAGSRAPGYRTPNRRRTGLPFGRQRAVVPRIDASSGTSRSAPAVASASSSVDNTAAAMRSGDWASRAIAL